MFKYSIMIIRSDQRKPILIIIIVFSPLAPSFM